MATIFRRVDRVVADRVPDAAQRRFIESAPVLAAVAEASGRGVVATGPRRGRRIIRIRGAPVEIDAFVMGKLCAQVEGFNLQAATRVRANDREGLERMARYLARPPIATDRLSQLDDGRLEVRLKRPWRDGTMAFVFTPHELIERLVALRREKHDEKALPLFQKAYDLVGQQSDPSSLCAEPAQNRGAAPCLAIYNQYTSERTMAIIGYAAGGALAVTSLTLFLISPSSSSSGSEKVAFGCTPDLINPGASCRFSF